MRQSLAICPNDVAELSGVVNLTPADVTLDTDRRDCSFKVLLQGRMSQISDLGPRFYFMAKNG